MLQKLCLPVAEHVGVQIVFCGNGPSSRSPRRTSYTSFALNSGEYFPRDIVPSPLVIVAYHVHDYFERGGLFSEDHYRTSRKEGNDSMLRVLLVIGSSLVNAGVPNVVMKIVRSLKTKCIFDIIVGSSNPGYYDEEFLSYGGNIYRYDKVTYEDGKLKLLYGGKQIYEIVSRILKHNKYDIIHTHEGHLSGWVLKAAKENNVSIRIAHSHGTYLNRGRNIPVRLFKMNSMKKIPRYATKCVACSNISGQTLFGGHEFENVLNPIDIAPYIELKKQPHSGINLIQIGYYCKLKNQLFSIEILRNLLQRGVTAQLHFIGYDNGSGYQSKLEHAISQYEIGEHVFLHPADSDKLEIFPQMDFLLLPSSSEGMPLTALEAQASHTYCLASTHVPDDCDMGLFTRMNVDNMDSASRCADWIIENKEYKDTLNMEKLVKLDTKCWTKRIGEMYGIAPEKIGGVLTY